MMRKVEHLNKQQVTGRLVPATLRLNPLRVISPLVEGDYRGNLDPGFPAEVGIGIPPCPRGSPLQLLFQMVDHLTDVGVHFHPAGDKFAGVENRSVIPPPERFADGTE